jgi:hypothetical protein
MAMIRIGTSRAMRFLDVTESRAPASMVAGSFE